MVRVSGLGLGYRVRAGVRLRVKCYGYLIESITCKVGTIGPSEQLYEGGVGVE